MTSRAEIESRLAAATPGPWTTADLYSGVWNADLTVLVCCEGERVEDMGLIAHAPDDLQYLLDVTEEIENELRAVGLPEDAPLSALIRHHRNNAALATALEQRAVIDRLIKAGEMFMEIRDDGGLSWARAATAWDEAKKGAA